MDSAVSPTRWYAGLLGSFAAAALLLAVIGIYGLMSFVVIQRRLELCVRIAIGATKSDIIRLVTGESLGLALLGVGMGIAGSFGLTRAMTGLIYGIRPTDLLSFSIPPVILVGAALMATYIPARRATQVDPISFLRCE